MLLDTGAASLPPLAAAGYSPAAGREDLLAVAKTEYLGNISVSKATHAAAEAAAAVLLSSPPVAATSPAAIMVLTSTRLLLLSRLDLEDVRLSCARSSIQLCSPGTSKSIISFITASEVRARAARLQLAIVPRAISNKIPHSLSLPPPPP